ncbi:MAG: UDP-3-O-acyl-N-acetylglucosamine deacetylase [bacterium]|jgi:UDP-3-O-[3-hydroxymyristoyl] N-acetylglucosamine deacetylase
MNLFKEYQVTLKRSIVIVGKGIHTGLKSKIILHPYDKGIVFKKSRKYIKLNPFKVVNTLASTDLVFIKTIEHLLAALFLNKIDNILVEVLGSEVPILDGSIYYFNKIFENNSTILDKKALYLKLNTINLEKFNLDLNYQIFSSDILKIYCIQKDLKKNRYFLAYYDENMSIYPAKTFGYINDYEFLKNNNLAKGADFKNTLILSVNKKNDFFYFNNELAYHKIIDFLGDIFTLQVKNIKAMFVLINPNHTLNNKLAKVIFKSIFYFNKELLNRR